jgi:hypothetical protein
VKDLKKGTKTSEFWVTAGAIASSVGTVLWSFVQQNCDLSTDKLVGLVIALLGAAGLYSIGRSWVKVKAME